MKAAEAHGDRVYLIVVQKRAKMFHESILGEEETYTLTIWGGKFTIVMFNKARCT